MAIEDFNISVSDELLADLSQRLKNSRWANGKNGSGWEYGTDKNYLKDFISYWIDGYDWKSQERELNKYPQFKCVIDDVDIHFFHIKGKGTNPLPIILSHGWPDSFIRYQKIIPLLTDPLSFGRNENDSFDVVIPSLPGFGFSSSPDSKNLNNADIADLWKKLMTEKLGYDKFGALGGDIGSGVTRYLAYKYPEQVLGIHLSDIGIIRDIVFSNNSENLADEEKQYKKTALQWISQEGAYMSIQSTKPQTLAFALSDSPIGLSAWILEKFHSWSDCDGNLENRYSKDELLNNIMIYWLSNSIGTSVQIYRENTYSLPPIGKIDVPTGIALFPKDILLPPRKWAEKNLNIIHWTEMPCGGHFTAMEAPEAYANDVSTFYRNFRIAK